MTTPVPGPPAAVLAAILVQNPDSPDSPLGLATFSQSGEPPVLPSLMNDVVAMPQDGLLDANGTWTGFLSTLGLTGAVAPTRWVGSTASGAPATGTFNAGDFATSQDGNVYICTAAGSPGTWTASGGTPSGSAGGDLSGTYPDPHVAKIGGTAFSLPVSITNGGTGSNTQNFANLLTPTGTKTSAYNAAAGDFVPCDSTGGSFTVTLPNPTAGLTAIGVKMVKQSGTNAVTIACGGSDVFNVAAGATTLTLPLLFQGVLLQYRASGGIWYVFADDLPLGALDSRYVTSATLTTLGDTLYENATPAPARLAGNTATQIKYLSQTGTGSVSAVPAWSVVSGTYLRSPAVVTTGTTYSTTSATFAAISAGTVSTGSFTAPASGEVVVEVDIVANTTASVTYGFALATTATITPIVGSIVGGQTASANPYQPTHLCFPVTGLSGGTAYNYDVLFAVTSGTLSCPALGSAGTTLTSANKGAPIVVAVKAV